MADQKNKRTGLRHSIERILGAEPASIGFAGRASERHTHALVLGVEVEDVSSLGKGHEADFAVFTKGTPGNEAPAEPWGVSGDVTIDDADHARPDFVVVGLDGRPTGLTGASPSLVVLLDDDIPPELVRPLSGLRPDAVVVRLDVAAGGALRVRDLLRLGFLAGSIQAPVLARSDAALDRDQLESLSIVGIAGVLLTGPAVAVDVIRKVRASIDGIDPKELRQRRGADRERPVVVPFAPRRTEEVDDGDEEDGLR